MTNIIKQNQWHTVADGENLFQIAKHAGFRNWKTIFNHANNKDFREANPSPSVIHTGDRVWIPEKTPHPGFQCEIGEESTMRLIAPKAPLRMILKTDDDIPYAKRKYEIWIDNHKYGDEERRTSPDGEINIETPVVSELQLKIWHINDASDPIIYTIEMGGLDPIDTIEGVQDRLNNLGYGCGEEHGQVGPETESALMAFQSDFGLMITGEINPLTQQKLEKENDL